MRIREGGREGEGQSIIQPYFTWSHLHPWRAHGPKCLSDWSHCKMERKGLFAYWSKCIRPTHVSLSALLRFGVAFQDILDQ